MSHAAYQLPCLRARIIRYMAQGNFMDHVSAPERAVHAFSLLP